MYSQAVLRAEPRALHHISDARAAIVHEARETLRRVRECARMAPSQRAGFIQQLEEWIARAPEDPEIAAKLDALDTQVRRVLQHLSRREV